MLTKQCTSKSSKSTEEAFTCGCGDWKGSEKAKQDVDVWKAYRISHKAKTPSRPMFDGWRVLVYCQIT